MIILQNISLISLLTLVYLHISPLAHTHHQIPPPPPSPSPNVPAFLMSRYQGRIYVCDLLRCCNVATNNKSIYSMDACILFNQLTTHTITLCCFYGFCRLVIMRYSMITNYSLYKCIVVLCHQYFILFVLP